MIGICAFVLVILIPISTVTIKHVTAQPSILKDTDLKVQPVVSGLSSPTSMAFIDSKNVLVLEKAGNVRLVSNGQLQSQPVLHVSVDITSERGLLGITVKNSSSNFNTGSNNKVVFLYYTESQGGEELRNKVYRYEWNSQSLINPKLILDFPGLPGPNHDGGKITIGPNGYLYAVIWLSSLTYIVHCQTEYELSQDTEKYGIELHLCAVETLGKNIQQTNETIYKWYSGNPNPF
jgi:hypothetical protein